MNYYQLTYLLAPDAKGPQRIGEEIKKEGGKISSSSEPKKRKLGYSLGKEGFSEAFLGTMNFYLEPKKVNKIKEKVSSLKEVLRTMVLSQEEKPKKEPSPKRRRKEKKVELKDIDKKLDAILESHEF